MIYLSVMAVALAGFALTVGAEALLVPRPAWRRPLSSWLLHAGVWCALLGVLFLFTGRPWFSGINALAGWLLVVLVSNAKYHSLREPFVCADFEYFSDAVRFPRLYLPFFGIGKAIGLALVFVVYLAGGLYFEPRAEGAPWAALGLLVVAGLLLSSGHRQWREPSFEPSTDLRHWGLVACLWRYYVAARRPVDIAALASPFIVERQAQLQLHTQPDMVSVQSESFFDVRQLFRGVRREVLSEFDRLRAEALAHGPLQVAAWGANTVRTEFAYLTGLDGTQLGVHRFNPYRLLARRGLPSIAAQFKRQGYRTVCIHPYAGSFYGRDKVLPALGFDEFIDVRAFNDSQKAGPFIGDCAVAQKVIELLKAEQPRQPLFIHVVTMENHGPLQLEQVGADELATWFSQPLAPALRDLGPYVRHIANADRMLGLLRTALDDHPRPAGLCFYGDHVPILPEVYKALGEPAGDTQYFVWSNRTRAASVPTPLAVQHLGECFIGQLQAVQAFEQQARAKRA